MDRMKNGSITVYLSLMLSALVSLCLTAVYSARIAAGRVILSSAAEQGIYSLFSEYDADFFERYGVLLLPSGNHRLLLGKIPERAREYASYILEPKKGISYAGIDPVGLKSEEARLKSYSLISDEQCSPLLHQIASVYREKLLKKGVSSFLNQAKQYMQASEKVTNHVSREEMNRLEGFMENMSESDLSKLSSDFSENDQEASKQWIERQEKRGISSEHIVSGLKNFRSMGFLSLVIPGDHTVSAFSADGKELFTGRQKQIGMGAHIDGGYADTAAAAEYALEYMPSFLNRSKDPGFCYQVEFLIAGKSSDTENLRSTLHQILWMREAANYVFLETDPEKRAETYGLAAMLCSAFLMPQMTPYAAMGIRGLWAYAESVLDVRTLLRGGKIPAVKTKDSWKLSMEGLIRSGVHPDQEKEQKSGLDYNMYLRMLLLLQKKEVLAERIGAMMEQTMRNAFGRKDFYLDCCLDGAEIEFCGRIGAVRLYCSRFYRYGRR